LSTQQRPLAGTAELDTAAVRSGQVPSLKLNANLMKLAHFNDLGPAKKRPFSFNLITTGSGASQSEAFQPGHRH